jgi:signal peptidase I
MAAMPPPARSSVRRLNDLVDADIRLPPVLILSFARVRPGSPAVLAELTAWRAPDQWGAVDQVPKSAAPHGRSNPRGRWSDQPLKAWTGGRARNVEVICCGHDDLDEFAAARGRQTIEPGGSRCAGRSVLMPTVVFAIAVLAAVATAIPLLIVVDAVRLARRGEGSRVRWSLCAGAILVVWIVTAAAGALVLASGPSLSWSTLSIPSWRTFSIPSGSMAPTLRIGDYLLADMNYYAGHAPARGDVVIHRLPTNDAYYVKRIVALPGDRIAFRDGHVILNGRTVTEPYADLSEPKAFYNTTQEWTVPAGHVFVAGDNRGNSVDSRVTTHGPVPMKNVLGRTTFIFLAADIKRIGSWVGNPD